MNLRKTFIISISLFTSIGFLMGCNQQSATHTHSYKLVSEVAATCDSDGIKAHYECEGCDKQFDFEKHEVESSTLIIPAHHSLVHSNKEEATCSHDGHKEFWSCSSCGKLFDDSEGKHEVSQSDLIITNGPHSLEHFAAKESNCTETGNVEYWYCSECHDYFLDNEGNQKTTLEAVTTPISHVLEHVNSKEASCSEPGCMEHYECTRCGKFFSDGDAINEISQESVIIPMSHDMVHHTAVEETCTVDGNIEYWYCNKCEKYFSDVNGSIEIDLDDTVIPASHKLVHHLATETSCDHSGNTEYWSCSRCNKYYSDENCTVEIAQDSWVIPTFPHTYGYSYDATKGKIIKLCSVCGTFEEITPELYVPRLRFYASNPNAVQFHAGELTSYLDDGSGNILHGNILNLDEGYSSSIYAGKTDLLFWSDASKTIGFYQDGMLANPKQGDTLEFNDLIFTQGDKYYVIGYAGAVYSATVEKFININGEVKNSSIGWAADNNGWNYINLDADFTVETNYWDLIYTNVGETWTSGGGTNFKVTKVISGVESDYFECTKGFTPRGAAPEFAEIDLYYNKETTKQKLRISFPTEGLTAGDKYILKAGATFTDTAFHAVLLREDAEFIFNGSTINLNLGNVDLSCATPSAWENPFSFRIPSLVFDMTNRNGDGNYEANPASQSNGVANFSMISFVLTDTNDVKYTNVSSKPQYFNMSALLGMQGILAFTDHTIAVGDVVTIPTGSYITIPGCGTYLVSQGVSMRATAVASPNITWVIA